MVNFQPENDAQNQLNPLSILKSAFPGIADSEAEEILATSSILDFPQNTTICHEGASETTFYIILEGEVEVTKIINDKESRLLKHLTPGDFFGEMAIIHNSPRAATVKTVIPTTALVIYQDAFSHLLERSSSVSLAVVRVVSQRLRDNDEMAIEDLRENAKELANAYQKLAEQEFARREFLTTIAHELRTPLMTANGFLQMIRSGRIQGEALAASLDTVARNLQDIVALTNDILFLQEMELIMPEFNRIDIGAVVASAVEQQRTHADRNRVGFNLSIVPDLSPIPGDAKSLGRAFAAILDNAVKFSPNGGEVDISVTCDENNISVAIRDNGVGIPLDAIPKIFDRFFHLDQVQGYLFRGVGLGLSIALQVIQQHHGEIKVISELDRGSNFTVILPISQNFS